VADSAKEVPAPGMNPPEQASAWTHRSEIARAVAEFHRAYELPLRSSPTPEVGAAQVTLRQALIEEEVAELGEAASRGDLVGIADALADIVYVAYGTAHVYGIDLDAVLAEVHASNMTKLGVDGRPVRRADGKILKGPAYRPPDVAEVLRRMLRSIVS
jgi:predicted HAD superfamily Cof-like phosphohydrolase